jgi:hypothetical protein
MNILNIALHLVDVATSSVSPITMSTQHADLKRYIEELLEKITSAESKRKFKFGSNTTEVKSSINRMLQGEDFDVASKIVADRLLTKEILAQADIAQLKYEIQKGVLIQAVIEKNNRKQFVIAKADHSNYLDDQQYRARTGLPIKKKIYKAFLAQFDASGRIIHLYVYDTNASIAKYWWSDFLELTEENTDEHNTDRAFESIDKGVMAKIKEEYRADHNILRNRMLGFFRSSGVFEMDAFIENTIGDYEPINSALDVEGLKSKIRQLPEKKGFDTQFNIKVEVIKAKKLKNVIPINDKIELHINDYIGDLSQIIHAYVRDGEKYIRIKTDSGYEAFKN